jgi:luciferase family oxidoreductase group 1
VSAYSILDLVRVTEATDAKGAIENARDLARHGEGWGFGRFWIAEHHNTVGIASAATSILLSYVAAGTSRIRVGSGGIMLPNHAPLIIAEQFGTLAQIYPDRIDLGLGRAPGTDQSTVRALRRSITTVDSFPDDVAELQSYFCDSAATRLIQAVPAAGTNVPLWILGSSTYGAQLAGKLGLPYAFGAHFAPSALHPALQSYRTRFQPSAQLAKPYTMITVNIIAADTIEQAQKLATTQQMSFVDLFRGNYGLSKPPIDDIEKYWSPQERTQANGLLARSIIGDADVVRAGIEALIEETDADELMIVSDIYDHRKRLCSYEIIAAVMQSMNADPTPIFAKAAAGRR